jgi:hypothetical protein
MSATSTAIHLETRGAAQDVSGEIRRLSFLRRVWRACALVSYGAACVMALACLLGVVDDVRPLARAWRVALVAPLFFAVLALLAYVVRLLSVRRSLSRMAREVERAAGRSENALVTFAENVERARDDAQPYMLARLERQARAGLAEMDERAVAPRRHALRGAGLLCLMLLVLLVLRLFAPASFAREVRRIVRLEADAKSLLRSNGNGSAAELESQAVALERLRVRVVPPSYSGLSAEEVVGDAPVRALAGSQIEVELAATGHVERAALSFGGATNQMRALGEGRYSGSFIPQASGAFEARLLSDENAPAPVVRAVEVYADAPPEAHLTEPASDQLLRGLPASPVAVRWTARDDLGLADVTLKYIKSRGEGDAAQFTNGVITLGSVERGSVRDWRGGATLDLARLGMQPGDTLVYWLEARDRNPAANGTGRSATLAIAITAPEPVKLNLGDLGPNEIGRFLLSQRMIIIHTEKLHGERARLTREELNRRAQGIAAEQREFKNSFNDYIRIEGAGEEPQSANSTAPESLEEQAQAAAEERTGIHMHGIPEPPQGTPNNVRDMIYAIRAMWDAEDALSLTDTGKALTYEREALTRLKRAQLAVRYVPPIVARSKPIDLKRRYAGELNEIKTRLEKLSRRAEAKETAALKGALADAYAALSDLQATLDVPVTARASAVARARERARASADRLQAAGGEHAATIAEAAGQLRIVETELSHLDIGGTSDEYAARVSKSLSLLTQAASNLFAIAEATTRATSGEANTLLPADDARAAEYFRQLNK